jgi:hypothetical protein
MKTNKNNRGFNGKGRQVRNGRRPEGVRDVATMSVRGNQLLGFPPKLLAKVRYVDSYALTSTVGSVSKQVMILNSTFDPDNTGSGHQPLYRDTFAGLYDQYAVTQCDVVVKFVNTSATPITVGCVYDDDNSTSGTVNTLCEQTTGQHTIVPALTGSLSSTTFRYHWDCETMLGIDPYASETYKTAVGSNPSESADFLLWASATDGASTGSVVVHVEMVFTVLWTELTTPTQS